MSLSICLVTRNHASRVAVALRSVADLGAQLIVADTGSTDATADEARAAGAHVLAVPWHHDFSEAQNQALAAATTDWVLWLNPDEELVPTPPETMAALLARADVLAYGVRVLDIMRGDAPEQTTEIRQLRLYRRDPDLHYVGRLHPHFAMPAEELARRRGLRIGMSELTLRRHSYLSTPTKDKVRWVTRLLELELHDRPGQLHYLIEYGRNLLRLNDPRGHTVLAEAAEQVRAARAQPTAPEPNVASLLEYLLTVSPEQSQSPLSAADVAELAERWFQVSPPLVWCLAQRRFQAEDFTGAARCLERLVQMGRTGAYDHTVAFDPTIVAEAALINLGRCYARLGQLDRAEACLRPLLDVATHQDEARRVLAVVQRMRGQP
jgi:hypothetical protein